MKFSKLIDDLSIRDQEILIVYILGILTGAAICLIILTVNIYIEFGTFGIFDNGWLF